MPPLPFRSTISVLALLVLSVATSQAQSGLYGIWREPTGSMIEVAKCGTEVCMRVVAISAKAPAHTDIYNPDPNMRSRSLCGLEIGRGFHSVDDHTAEGGVLYDPKSGKTYKGSVTRVGDELRLRGYIAIKLFGATQTWVRAVNPKLCRP